MLINHPLRARRKEHPSDQLEHIVGTITEEKLIGVKALLRRQLFPEGVGAAVGVAG